MLRESKRGADESVRIREILELCIRKLDPEHGLGDILDRYGHRRIIIEERRRAKAEQAKAELAQAEKAKDDANRMAEAD